MRAVQKWKLRSTKDPSLLADEVAEIVEGVGAVSVKVDAIGLGWGVGALVKERCPDVDVVPVKVSEAADDHEHFLNLRAELWWRLREWCREGEVDFTALDDDDAAEVTSPRYHTRNPRGRIQIESKDDIRKRLKRSPDSADALILAFHRPWTIAEVHGGGLAGINILGNTRR
jgi:hypothetical protein